jgi:ubiquitin carboxyl-terminal hydrolase L3
MCLARRRGLFLLVCSPCLGAHYPTNALAENNPEVMTSLVHNLGLSNKLAFHDVFSIDDPDLLAFVPRPAYALLLIFPVSETYEDFRVEEDKERQVYDGHGPEEDVIWYKQTIGNACGLIGLLHGVSNGTARSHVGTSLCISLSTHSVSSVV